MVVTTGLKGVVLASGGWRPGRLLRWAPHAECSGRNVPIAKSQTVKNLPAMRETCVRSLHREDPLEEGMATHSSILAWRIPCTEESGGLQSKGLQRVRHD